VVQDEASNAFRHSRESESSRFLMAAQAVNATGRTGFRLALRLAGMTGVGFLGAV
jgi:hypothetical protein